jgi:acetylornithine deacetylase
LALRKEKAQVVGRERLVSLAANLARIRSTRDKGEAEIGEFLAAFLEQRSFVVDIQDVIADRFNVIARIPGHPAFQSIMLNGHLDMPSPVDGWKRSPFAPVVEDDWLYGAGLTDMKGGLAALVAAADAVLDNAGRRDHGDVIVTAVIHHDTIGLGTKYFLDANDVRIDAGINGEPTALKVQLAHGGSYQFKVVLHGATAHTSRQEDAFNAIDAGVEVAQALRRDLPDRISKDPEMPFLPRVVVGRISGGTGAALSAVECVVEGDVRYPVAESAAKVGEAIEAVVRAHAPSGRASVYRSRYQRPFVSDADWPIVRLLAQSHRRYTGLDPSFTKGLPAGAYISDAADMVRCGIPTVVYGPGDWRMIPDERISITEMCTAAEVYALTVMEWISIRRE